MKQILITFFTALMSFTFAETTAFPQAPPDNAFTYQGKLNHSGAAANGPTDFEFRLFDAPSGGSQIGATQAIDAINVADGLFTVILDFGPEMFEEEPRYLEIAVSSPAGSGQFATLTPRQRMTAAPFAHFAARPWSFSNGNLTYSGGPVGIGSASPERPFHVSDAGLFTARFESDHPVGSAVEFKNTSSQATWEYAVAGDDPPFQLPAGSMYIYKQGTSKPGLSISPDGKVAIGKKPPIFFAKLDVRTEVGVNENIAIYAHSYDGVGIVAGSSAVDGAGVQGVATSSGVNYGVLGNSYSSDGYDFFAAGAGINYGSSSSRRWKHNLAAIDDPLGMLAQMRGVYFDWDADHGGHHDIGMIAEEVGQVLPEVVSYEKNGIDAVGMDYSKLTPLLVEAVKAQQAQINAIQQENAQLSQKLQTIMRLLDEQGISRAE